MRMVARLFVLALLSPVLYVVSAVAWFPAVCWHSRVAPQASTVMAYRVAEAAAAGTRLQPRHAWVPLNGIADPLVRAVLVAEDTRFYEHHGFDFVQIRDAWRVNRSGGRLRGASTISQQTAKNLYLDPSRNFLRKGREALLTAWLELWFPKSRILETYLNVVELGPGIFGAGAAARMYFDRSPAELTRSQAALLAATLPAPLVRNPAASTGGLRARQRMILSRMSRWHERPSLAAEEATARTERLVEPETRPSEAIELEALDEEPAGGDSVIDVQGLDIEPGAGEDEPPGKDVPPVDPPDSITGD